MNNPYETLDILITGGTLLTMEPPGDIVADPVIGIRDGRIIFVEEGGAARGELPEAREVLDGSGCLVMPGLVNTHTHLPMVLFRGLADDLPLMRWLNDHIFPAEERFINRETVYAGSQLAIAEMILSGTTTFCDGYFFESSVARAAVEAGMRGIVAQGFIDFPAPDQQSSVRKGSRRRKFRGEMARPLAARYPGPDLPFALYLFAGNPPVDQGRCEAHRGCFPHPSRGDPRGGGYDPGALRQNARPPPR